MKLGLIIMHNVRLGGITCPYEKYWTLSVPVHNILMCKDFQPNDNEVTVDLGEYPLKIAFSHAHENAF